MSLSSPCSVYRIKFSSSLNLSALQAVLHKMDLLKSKAKDIPETNNKVRYFFFPTLKVRMSMLQVLLVLQKICPLGSSN